MKITGALITGLVVCFLFMFLGCSETPTSLEDQKANLETLNKNGVPGGGGGGGSIPEPDEDSDRPPWAGGNTDANEHPNPNDDSGTMRGGDYGDLFIVVRNADGAPIDVDGNIALDKTDLQPIAFYIVGDGVSVDADGIPEPAVEGELLLFSYDEVLGTFVAPLDDEGLPRTDLTTCEVNFGRLNLIRAPERRLTQALDEAVLGLNDPTVIDITIDFCGRILKVYEETYLAANGDVVHVTKAIDSPRENMGIYRELMTKGFGDKLSVLADHFSDTDIPLLLASVFAAGGDKTGYVIEDEIVYCNEFLNLNDFDWGYAHYLKYDFSYNRDIYINRFIRMKLTYDEAGKPIYDENAQPISITQAMDDQYFKFTNRWGLAGFPQLNIAGFRTAADDAVQVLEFIHGDSNIEYRVEDQPGWVEPSL